MEFIVAMLLLITIISVVYVVHLKGEKQSIVQHTQYLEHSLALEKEKFNNEYNQLVQQAYYEQRAKILQNEIETIKDQAKKDYQEYYDKMIIAAKTAVQEKIAKMHHEEALIHDKVIAHCSEMKEQIAAIDKELAEKRRQKDATIEALKREELIKKQKDFYSIQLTSDDFSDILIIENLSNQIHKRVPLQKLIWSEYYARPYSELADRVLGKNKRCGIYKITEIETDKVYIGQSTDIRTRWANHLKTILGADGGAARTRFHDYAAKVGVCGFTFELIEDCTKEQLNEREKYYINLYRANDWGFNSTIGNKTREEK